MEYSCLPQLVFTRHFLTMVMEVVRGEQGHAPCKISFIKQILGFVSVKFFEDHLIVTTLRCIWPPSTSGNTTECKIVVPVYVYTDTTISNPVISQESDIYI